MTRHAREAVSLAAATALGEVVLCALVTTDWERIGEVALRLAFLAGAPLFAALLAWRRRTHPARSKVLFGLVAAIAVGGFAVLGSDLYRFNTDAQFRRTPNWNGVILTVVQWSAAVAVWVWLAAEEAREPRGAGKPGHPT